MCINKKRIYNKWTHSWMYTPCGVCPACQQQKAIARTQRIKHAVYNGYVNLFVTLTYRNINIPYILKNEIQENSANINIYRDCSVRRVRYGSGYDIAYKYDRHKHQIGTIDCFKYKLFPDKKDISKLSKLRGQRDPNKVGVLFYKDVQDFEKRLRQNLVRHFQVLSPIYTFKCSELGPSTQRPHFHLLISVPQENLAECKSAIVESWPYDSRITSAKSIQIARNAASYVSSYVNRGSDFPRFMDCKPLRPKHSFSKGYGTTSVAFTLPRILESFERGSLTYDPNELGIFSTRSNVIYPQYALRRYFGKCYGYSRLSYDEIKNLVLYGWSYLSSSDLLPRMFRISKLDGLSRITEVNFLTQDYDYDFDKAFAFLRQLDRQYYRFIRDFEFKNDVGKLQKGLPDNMYSRELYADYYYRIWSCYASTVNRLKYDKVSVQDIPFLFENYDEVYEKKYRSDILSLIRFFTPKVMKEPNLFARNVNSTLKLTSIYNNTYKRKKIINRVMANNKFNV